MRRQLNPCSFAPAFALSLALALVAIQARAAPPAKHVSGAAKAACLAAHEEALSLRAQKRLHAAREKLVECARVECPTVVRKECGEQVALVAKDAPTVVLEARDEAGADTTAVKVSLDGTSLTPRLTGSAVDVEPGEHVFRFERADGKAVEQRVLVMEGDKNRKVVAEFASLTPRPAAGPGAAPAPPHEVKKVPVLTYVAGGVGLAAVGSFAFFALSGKSAESDLASSCSPSCSDGQLSTVKRDYFIADVSLGVSVVAAVVAVVLALPALTDSGGAASASITRRAPPPWMPRLKVRVLP